MQLHNPYLVPTRPISKASFLEHGIRSRFRHAIPNQFHSAATIKRHRLVRDKCLRDNLNRLILQAILVHKVLGCNNTRRSTIGRRRTHVFRELIGDLGRLEHLLNRPAISELRVWINRRVPMVLRRWTFKILTKKKHLNIHQNHLSAPNG